MKKKVKTVAGIISFMIVSCAVITVNIYFPEKEVKDAYKELEKELMTPQKDEKEKPGVKPESSIKWEFVASAYAQEPGLAGNIAEIVKKMPDEVNAYR